MLKLSQLKKNTQVKVVVAQLVLSLSLSLTHTVSKEEGEECRNFCLLQHSLLNLIARVSLSESTSYRF
ncbi:hypothetical protein LWI28_005968 [Acer negundo]|uniref:Uncharacterized protein n=1 Tax=Acer negundo TaxID=4023 RepID=A0AAD5IIK2_ACENE|nr:hypothetical protein LWI28_005968 [Acer negundo]